MQEIIGNIEQIQKRINNACEKCNRNPKDIKLLLATKTVSPERIKTAIQNGAILIAENKIQELKEKHEYLKDIPHINHFIGHLQSNKIKYILKYDVICLQSLDRIELAEKLHQRLTAAQKTIDVLIQVNTSSEESKFGVTPENTIRLVQQVAQFDTIKIKGLMTIGVFSSELDKVRKCFRILKNLQQEISKIQIPNVEMNELSMGMSGDLEIAIEEGATIIRVGTAVFGKRIYPDSYYWDETSA
ncbi:MAG TPA: YggS family pyridoxal phosphate-dependent enzyme [Chitinophagales bacterium]|nr:YggS family pyridoxal phosphate-dependent enzyme [Chitinophagales bacterium]